MKPTLRPLAFAALLVVCAALAGCQESSLSDVEIDDPALLQPAIKLKKSYDLFDNPSYAYDVFIYDENDDLLELKNGEVTVEGEAMTVARLVGDLPYYRLDPPGKLPFLFDTTYAVAITLPNGTSYASTVKTPPEDLTSFDVPDEHDRDSAMVVSWTPADPEAVMTLEARYRYPEGSGVEVYQINQPGAGSYVVPRALFNREAGIYKVEFALFKTYYGEINPAFMSGSSILARISRLAESTVN
jgi:hypothetical protein